MMRSTKGTPANTIQGTRQMVSRKVRWYSGYAESGSPNRARKRVIEG